MRTLRFIACSFVVRSTGRREQGVVQMSYTGDRMAYIDANGEVIEHDRIHKINVNPLQGCAVFHFEEKP